MFLELLLFLETSPVPRINECFWKRETFLAAAPRLTIWKIIFQEFCVMVCNVLPLPLYPHCCFKAAGHAPGRRLV